MPCSKYKGKQRALCHATNEWKDWSKIRTAAKPKFVGSRQQMEQLRNAKYPASSISPVEGHSDDPAARWGLFVRSHSRQGREVRSYVRRK